MEDLTEDEMLIRAMEESLKHYEEVERPLRQLANEEAPCRNSMVTRPNEVVRPPESKSRSSWPNSSGFVKEPVTKPGVAVSSSASTFKPVSSSRVVPPLGVPNSAGIDSKSGSSAANSWSNSSVTKPGTSTGNSWGNSNVAKPGPSTANSWSNSNVAKPGPSTANSWSNSNVAKPGPSTANSWNNSSVAKPGSSTANSWGNSNATKSGSTNSWSNSSVAKPGTSTGSSWGNSSIAKPGPSTANSWGNSKPGPSRGAGNNTLPSLWQTMEKKRTAQEQEVQDKVQTEEADGTLQLLSDSKTLTENGFCRFTGRHWVYPTNYPERKYQLDMVQTALFHNTLVCLPTGLGKTFIAAVVMYNFYRWYPKGKIIFMAPTKPLVAQQIKACYDITGIPREHTEELTGTMNVERRTQAWKNKRVFFATPQVVANDLVAQVCPAEEVRCMVVDEAHRAQGDFAYCQVVSTLRATSTNFRLLALSATPGTDIKAVQQVLVNLHISKLKIATEDSPEIAQYTHHREVEIVTVAATPELNEARDRFQTVMGQYLQPLIQNNLVSGYNLSNLTMFQMKTHLDKLSRQPPSWMSATDLSRMKNLCLVCISLCHAQELLQNYGLRSFLSNIQGVLQDSKTNKVVSGYLSRDEDLLQLVHELNEKLNGKPKKEGEKTGGRPTILYGHPKLQKLQQIVADHFYDYDDRQESTRAIIFCQYRDSVEEIKNMLKVLEPVVKPMSFVGQAKSKGSVGLTQKQQLQVMRDFRSGDFNTLISTSVGEEGLDIGEVDLIVCMDANKSPIRLMQRMGRTGRKRAGKIIMLLSEGKEHKKYIDSTKKQSSISKNILNNQKLLPVLNQNSSPRMIPEGVSPKVYKTVLVIPREAKEQDIRKVMRKASSLPDLLPAFLSPAEIAKWDGTVPEFNHLETTVNSDLLAFCSLDSIFEWSSQESLNQKPPGLDLYDFLEWQRSLQGSDEAPHSKDSMALSALLQLADKMTLNNPELLTQTTDLVTEVDHDTLWGSLKGTKGQGRGKRGRPAKEAPPPGSKRGDIAWCLQKQGQKRVPEISLEDASDFVLPIAQKNSELDVSLPAGISEALERLESSINSLQIDPETPVCRMFRHISLTSEAMRKANNKHIKPDFLSVPPDIKSVDTILATLRIEYEERLKARVKHVDDDFSPDTLQQIDNLTKSAPVLAKRTFNGEPSTSTSAVNRDKIIPKKSTETIPPLSSENKIIRTPQKMNDDDIKIIPEVNSPIKPQKPQKLHDISQGMTDFLMNFDIGFEDDDCFASLDVKQPTLTQKIVTPKKNGMTKVEVEKKEEIKKSEIKGNNSSLMDFDVLDDNFIDVIPEKTESPVKTKPPEMKVETESKNIPRAKSPEKPFQISFDVLDDENDLFADIDISSWMGELEKRGYESQVLPPSTSPPPLADSKKPQIPVPTSPSLLSSIKPKVPVKPSTPEVAPKPSTSNTPPVTPASVSKMSPDLFSEGESSPHIIKPLAAKPSSSSLTIANPMTSQSPNVAAKGSPNIFTSSSSNSFVVAMKGTPTSPISATSVHGKSSILATKTSPNIFTSSSSSSSITAMKGTPTSPISITRDSNVAIKTSPHIFTSSSSGSPLACRVKTETKKSSSSPGDTLKLTPSSINTTLKKSQEIFNFDDTVKQMSTSTSDSHQSKVPTDTVDLRPLKVPSKLSMKSRVVNGVRSEVPAKVQQNSTQDDDSFIEVTKRKSSERRQALIVSSDESSPEKGRPRGKADVDSSPDVRKVQQRRRIVDNDSSPDIGKRQERRRNVDYQSSPNKKKGQVNRRNVDIDSSPDVRKRPGRSSSPDTTMKPSQSLHSITISSDDESSPDTKHKRKVHSISEEESPEAIVISSDDEFKTPVPVKTSKRKSDKELKKQVKKHKKSVKGFLDMEAEVSGEDDSGDDMEDSQMDRYDESFIKAEATQADSSIDMRAQYLRSVRSPLQGHGRYKIPQLQPARGRLLSPGNHGDHDDSSYMNDSFCVDTEGEEEEGDSEDSHAELEALEAKLEKQKTRKKRDRQDEVPREGRAGRKRDRKSFSSQEEEVTRKKMKLNRIIVHSSSEDEEPAAVLPSSKPSPPPPPQATSTPVNHNMVRGFEDDYVDDDDMDALLARINMTQEIEKQTRKQASLAQESRKQAYVAQESKKPASRSLFNDQDRPSTSKSLRRQPDLSDDEWEVSVRTSNTVEPKPGPSGSGTLSLKNKVQTGSRQEVVTKPLLGLKQQSNVPQAKSSRSYFSEDSKELPMKSLSLASKQTVKPSDIRQESAALETRTSVQESRGLKNTLLLAKPVPNLPKLSDPSRDLERTAVVAPVVIPKAGPSTNEAVASSSRATVPSNQSAGNPVIIVSTRQVVSAPKLLTILRSTHKIITKLQTLPSGIDYVVSQRLAISRMQLQDVSSYNEKSDVVLTVGSVRQQFKFAVLVLENNASRPVPEPWKEASRHSLPGAKAHRTALCLMRQVDGLKVVFTKDQAETANIIQKLALKEQQCKYGIKQYCKESCDPAFDVRLKFFTHLPGVNIALALKLVQQFPVTANFIKSCSTIEWIEKTLGINKRQAAALHQVLSKPLQ